MDINQKLLAAFRVEYVEHLEGIRASLPKVESGGAAIGKAQLEEAFRHAHSLKGAARITGLSAIEMLAHRLESLFSQVRAGAVQLDEPVVHTIHAALDAIEDLGAQQGAAGVKPDITPTIAEIDRIVQGGPPPAPTAPQPPTLDQRLRQAFLEEYRAYLLGIRAVLTKHRSAGASPADLEEAFRCANSLRGAAQVTQFSDVEKLAARLETLLARVRKEDLRLDENVEGALRKSLDAIESRAAAPPGSAPSPQMAEATAGLERLLGIRAEPEPAAATESTELASAPAERPAAAPVVDTVRLSTENLDRLLQSTGRLLNENLHQDVVTRELNGISRQLSAIEREWDSVKRGATTAIRRLPDTPDVARLSRYLEFMENQMHGLARHTRSVRLLQQRSSWSLKALAEQLQQDVRRTRMIPAESVFQGFRKMMRDLARDEGKEFEFRATGFEVQADRMVLQALKDPVMHMLRNAVSHGIENADERRRRGKKPVGVVELRIEAAGARLSISVQDDGQGVDLAKVAEVGVKRGLISETEASSASPQELSRLLFQAGFSTARVVTELSGRGIGLSAVAETVTRLQGDVEVRPRRGGGTVVLLTVPLAISTHRLLLVSTRGQAFAVPLYGIEGLHRIAASEMETIEGKPMVSVGGQLTALTSLARLLDLGEGDGDAQGDVLQIMVLRSGTRRVAVIVDALLMERDALIKSLGRPASQVTKFAGGILLEDGSVALVLNPAELVEGFKPTGHSTAIKKVNSAALKKRSSTILVVDDSFTTRTLETSILQTQGYQVRVAVDGVEALNRLRSESVDLVITDLQMPRLDGFGLLEEMKKDSRLQKIPVIVVSSLDRREDQERGLSLGADAYIVKRKFDHQDLLQTIEQIL